MQIKEYCTMLDSWKTPILKETARYNIDGRKKIHNSEDIYNFCRDHLELDKRTEEYCYCICFDTQNRLQAVFECGHGTVNNSIFDIRGMLQKALLLNAVSVIVCHNHPSGDCTPSQEDIDITNRIKAACNIINVPLLDHVIIGDSFCSFKANNLL